ncbi:MAG TPA: AtzH-like domain-containing protein, partial [Pyrinomonadaceae bacterium]|nr:AtzH-like domain-containing protein [Pyrinomonadaceae bacterium]
KIFAALACAVAIAASAQAQNTNSSTTTQTPRRRPVRPAATATPSPAPADEGQTPATDATPPSVRARRAGQSRAADDPGTRAVRAAFDNLIKGIERSDVDAVMALYWNSPQLVVFNNNGTVTRGWEQVRSNRASSYPEAKEVKIDARDVRVTMLGTGGAVVSCLWRQTQEFRGTPESAAGRLTVVFRLINNGWRIVHTHSSPEAPDPSRLMPSEQTQPPTQRPVPVPPPK